jgi:hypothetical protein
MVDRTSGFIVQVDAVTVGLVLDLQVSVATPIEETSRCL